MHLLLRFNKLNIYMVQNLTFLIPMEDWWWILLFFLAFLSFALKHLLSKNKNSTLPPGPLYIPIISTLGLLLKSHFEIEPVLRNLRASYGPIITLRITSKPAIFISDPSLAHRALVQNGAAFANRPPIDEARRVISAGNISSAHYGPRWRLLRRNLTSEILHSSRIKRFAGARSWVLQVLLGRLKTQAGANNGVVIAMESFQFAMFCLLVLMCFGENFDAQEIQRIEDVQKSLHKSYVKFSVFAFLPKVTRLVFRERWRTLLEIRRNQEETFIPLIRARSSESEKESTCYVDSLLKLRIAEEGGRRLTEGETVTLCSEFLSGGTDTTATALEWIMAELVIRQEIQQKLRDGIEKIVPEDREIKEEDLQKMPYLKAVILEGLRRHPPVHFVLPHAVTEETKVGGYIIPKDALVNFMAAEMAWDNKVWYEPMEFKPERFLDGGEGEAVDITGNREIKMMPFGVGRRICPGLGLAMLHLEYFVANLVRKFEWKVVNGEKVDLSEKMELTVVMKNHLRARIIPRGRNLEASLKI